jgi:hypothetical protein
MIGLALLVVSTQARMSLQYYQGNFYISDGPFVFLAPTKLQNAKPDFVRFRRGDTYTVWDKRGLACRSGNWIYETRFRELAVSPKLFSKEAIEATLGKVKRGERNLDATAMAGSLRLGTDAYFLPRWIDYKGFTWLEVLVRVDLSSNRPKPILIGRFPGMSLANGSIDRRLIALKTNPAAVVRKGSEWGVSVFDAHTSDFLYTPIGERLRAYSLMDDSDIAFIEAEDSGLSRVGTADLMTGSRTDVLEDRGAIRALDGHRPLCALVVTPERMTIRNLQTASALELPPGSTPLRTANGVLVWWPKDEPKHAVLLDPDRWDHVASWHANEETGAKAVDPANK